MVLIFDEVTPLLLALNYSAGSAEQNAKHGAEDKVHIKMNAMRDRMKTREKNKPDIFDLIK